MTIQTELNGMRTTIMAEEVVGMTASTNGTNIGAKSHRCLRTSYTTDPPTVAHWLS